VADNETAETIGALVEESASRSPEGPAILALDRSPLGYAALAGLIGGVAAALAGRGIGREDRVALVVENGPEAATAFLSLAAGAACAPLNPSYRRHELDFFLSDLAAAALVVSSTLDTPARESAHALGLQVIELQAAPDRSAGVFRLDGSPAESAPVPEREAGERALFLHTSGTTSRPKLVPLTHGNLAVSARSIARTLELTPADHCLNVMPLFHVHGLVAALLGSLAVGGSVTCTPGFHPLRALDWLDACDPTWYTAVPTMHQALLARTESGHAQPARLRFIRSSSAALPRPVLEGLERAFGVPVVEAYGMTEAAHQMASNPPTLAARRPGSVGRAAGPEVAILSAAGEELPPGVLGEVAIRGANVFSGYERNPEANQEAFTNGWFRTGDEGTLDDDGYLTLHARIKELINRGGEKISPAEIDERLLEHPAVAEAVAFAFPDERLGEEVAAAVVLAAGHDTRAPELQEFVAQTLAPFKVPRRIVVVAEIPKGPTGKVQRIGLAERLELHSPTVGGTRPAGPRSSFEQSIAEVFAEVLDIPSPGIDDDFFALGGDSISGSEAVARLRELTGQALPLVSIVRSPTVRGMVAELDGVVALEHSGPILLEPGAGPPLYYVHGGDGEVLQFVPLARALGGSRSFYGIRARGIDDGEEPAASIEEMAADYLRRIRKLQPEGPYPLGGFCLGATVALEMAHQLEAEGERSSLVVVDPRLPRPKDPRYLLWLARRRAREGRLLAAAASRVRRTTDSADADNGPAAPRILTALAALRDRYTATPLDVPALVILGDQHERYSIPAWHVRRILPSARTVRIPFSHADLLRPTGAARVGQELLRSQEAV
jgi:oxalate---CoA ligase